MNLPAFPEYRLESKRRESFKNYPKIFYEKSKKMSDAGFFYSGEGDRVSCFHCAGGLKDWCEDDDPWENHAMWYGNCEYTKLVKGVEFINEIALQRSDIFRKAQKSSNVHAAQLEEKKHTCIKDDEHEEGNEAADINDEELCKICYINERNTIFLPCGHIFACARCALSIKRECAICRKKCDQILRAFL